MKNTRFPWPYLAAFLSLFIGVVASATPQAGQISEPVSLTTTIVGQGSIQRDPDLTFYTPGTIIALLALPADDFIFLGWTGPVADPTSPSTTIKLDQNALVSATFVPAGKPKLGLSIDPGDTLDFGTVETGLLSTPATRIVVVKNLGGGLLEGTAQILTPNDGRTFRVAAGNTFRIAPGESAEVLLVFDPFDTDFTIELFGVLGLRTNAGDADINLRGTAVLSGELIACGCAQDTASFGAKIGDALIGLLVVGALAGAGCRRS